VGLWLVCRNRAGTSRDCPSSLRGAGRQTAGVAQEVVPAEILASPSSGIRPFRRLWPEPARLRAREVVRFAPRTSCHRRRCSDHRRTPAPAVLGRNTPRDAPRHPCGAQPATKVYRIGFYSEDPCRPPPHLAVGDVEAGQMLIPQSLRRISSLAPSYATARQVLKNLPPGLVCRRSGLSPLLRQPTPGAFSS
jgi:hypothetical protein